MKKVRKSVLSGTVALILCLGGGLHLYAASPVVPDTVYQNGRIYTLSESTEATKDASNAKRVDIVAVKDGVICFVGSKAEAHGKIDLKAAKKTVDLKGKTLLPGFVDGHSHFPGDSSIDLFQVNLNCPPLGPVVTMQDLIDLLKTKVDSTPEGFWINGSNYDDSLIAEKRHPNKTDLDKVSTKHPVKAGHSSGHLSAVNSYAVNWMLANVGSVQNGVFVDKQGVAWPGVDIGADGLPTGVLREAAARLASGAGKTAKQTVQQGKWGYTRGNQKYTAAGVTTVDCGGVGLGGTLPALQKAIAENRFDVRAILHPSVMTEANHKALGWNLGGTSGSTDPESLYDDSPSADSPQNGADLTHYVPQGSTAFPDPSGLPQNRLFFGAWKQFLDGSNQGYTGYFKYPGYWDKAGQDGYDPTVIIDKITGERKEVGSTGKDGPLYGLGGTTKDFAFEDIVKRMDLYHRHGQSVETHTNGSWTAENYMAAIELAVARSGEAVKDTRHTFIHGQMEERQIVERAVGKYDDLESTRHMYHNLSGVMQPAGETITDALGNTYTADTLRAALRNGQLMQEQNLVSSYFVNHTYFWGDRHLAIYMGPGRGKQMNPMGWAAYYGHHYTSHNDTPVTPISPLRSVQSAVTRLSTTGQLISGSSKDINAVAMYPETKHGLYGQPPVEVNFWDFDQRLNTLQALHATTITPAFQNKIERAIGTLEEGKLADFVILDQDPMDVAQAAPQTLADIRVTTTIVGDNVVYGVLPDANSFIGKATIGYGDPNVLLTVTESSLLDRKAAEKEYGSIAKGEQRMGALSCAATVTDGKSGVFQFTFLGNDSTPASMKLYKLTPTNTTPYVYGKPTTQELADASGRWWIADMDAPTAVLPEDAPLKMDKTYIAFFATRDNDPQFDDDAAVGAIKHPILLATTGGLPTNGGTGTHNNNDDGGSSSGCTIGTTPAYDLMILLAGLSGVAVIRVLRRRGNALNK